MRKSISSLSPLLLLACSFPLACEAKPDAASTKAPSVADATAKATPEKASATAAPAKDVVLEHVVEDIDGKPVDLKSYRGKALLIVNTASECGFTPQYADLEQIYREYKDRGLVVLGFPSNDFGGQEPGSHEEIKSFTAENFEITFPLFAKVHATGAEKSPLYRTLTEETGSGIRGEVKWNFTKFLVDPEGRVVQRFESKVKPTDATVRKAIEAVLPKQG